MKTAEIETDLPSAIGVKMRKSSAAPLPPRSANGHGSASMSEDSDSTSGDSLEGLIELSVILPNEKCVRMSTEKRTPMMDLLVQVTKANGLSPGSFVLDVKSERSRDSIRYKPSTAVGSLNTNVVYVVAKSSIRDVSLVRKDTRTGNPPFEKTFRLRVHLPRNQLHVLRVSQTTPMIDVFSAICTERELNPSRYELRHPVHTEERLDPQRCLADYGLSEVAVVAVKGPSNGFSRSSSDIMSLQHDDDRKKHRFFGFMFKKSKSVSRSIGDTSSDGHSSRGVSPARSDGSGCQSISPPPSTAGYPAVNGASHHNNHNNNNKASKKRAAPPPPRPVAPNQVAQEAPLAQTSNGNELTATSHSRHSSDSSGYHEASILSDSIDAAGQDIEHLSDAKASPPNAKQAQVPSNLTTVNSTSMISVTSGPKKRKAPVPPSRSISSTHISNGQAEHPEIQPVALENNATSRNKSEIPPEENKSCNGTSVRRKDSVSSHASSTSEEIRSVTVAHKKAPAPIPLPRQSKSPAPMPPPSNLNEEKRTNAKESGSSAQPAVNGLNGAAKSSSDAENPAERRPSFGEVASAGQSASGDGVAEAFSELHVVNLDPENVRRMSSSSTLSAASIRKSADSEGLREKQAERVSLQNSQSSVESETKSNSRLTSVASYDETDTAASSRRSSVLSEASSHSTAISESSTMKKGHPATKNEGDMVQTSDEVREQTRSNSLKKRQEVSVQTNFDDGAIKDSPRSSTSSADSCEKEASGSSSRKSSCSHSEIGNGDDVVQTESHRTKRDAADNVSFAVAPLELSSLDENRNSDAMSDFTLQEDTTGLNSNAEALNDNISENNRRLSSDSSVVESLQASPKSRKASDMEPEHQKQKVKEADVTALSAQIDKSMSEHRIVAEIDEAFASIDSMEIGSDSDEDDKREVCETMQSSAQTSTSEVDPVITWEYRIPEVPAQFQNDYDENQEPDEKVPPYSKPQTPEVPPNDANVLPLAKGDEAKQSVPNAEMAQSKSSVQEVQEHILKRPVMSFSIATYRNRVEEESEYGRKLAYKAEQPPIQKQQLTKSFSLVENPPFQKPIIQAKPRVPEPTPGHSLSIAKALTRPAKPVETEAQPPAVSHGLRKTKSEMHLSGHLAAPVVAGGASGSSPEEQERLQQEYLKLHSQFLQWQQQLLQNQTVLQQQQILPESATETLQRIQELHQQFMSLPIAQPQPSKQEVASVSGSRSQKPGSFGPTSMDFPNKTNSLPRPKSAFAMPPAVENKTDFSNSLERKLPRTGPRPWVSRPVSMSLGSWQPRKNPQGGTEATTSNTTSEPNIIIENKTDSKPVSSLHFSAKEPQGRSDVSQAERAATSKNAENVPRQISIKERVSSLNATSNEKPAVVSRLPSQPSFPRCPVVKGFANQEPMVQQQKSRVIVNSAPKANGTAVTSQQKAGIVRVDIKPQSAAQQNSKPVANTYTYFGDRVDVGSANKAVNGNRTPATHDNRSDALGKITVNAMNHNNNNMNNNNNNSNKNYTTVMVNAAPSRQQSTATAPPPPPPPASLNLSLAKVSATTSNGLANRRSVSSPEVEEDTRDVLMMAIRGFGGRTGLKKVSSSETGWQTRHGNL